MRLAFRIEPGIECWEMGGDYYLYGVTEMGDSLVLPSLSMAWDVAWSALVEPPVDGGS